MYIYVNYTFYLISLFITFCGNQQHDTMTLCTDGFMYRYLWKTMKITGKIIRILWIIALKLGFISFFTLDKMWRVQKLKKKIIIFVNRIFYCASLSSTSSTLISKFEKSADKKIRLISEGSCDTEYQSNGFWK